jgi:anti-repressor protein|nr:MAG TPA: repressor domain protein [Caudoviricetes sp.]
MNEIKIFENQEFGKVRALEIDGKPYFVGKDVAEALGYKDTVNALKQHCRGVVKHHVTDSIGRNQESSFIPEGDVYRLIVRSKLPSAEKFEKWVFDEVLPSIRQTGGYQMTMPQGKELLALAVLEAQKTIEAQNKDIERMKPKEIFADAVSASHTTILIGELAKLLRQNGIDIGAKRLFAWMRDNGYLVKRQGTDYNTPTQKSVDLGVLTTKETTVLHPDGSTKIVKTAKVTGKGQQYFINKFLKAAS